MVFQFNVNESVKFVFYRVLEYAVTCSNLQTGFYSNYKILQQVKQRFSYTMQLIEVTTATLARDFIKVNVEINKGNTNYIRPLDKDVNEVFDKKKNKAFRHGKCIRWILKDNSGKLTGRIAAFTNKKYRNKGDDVPVGGIGFFDCINDQGAANLLFDTAKQWLTANGMEAMDGPVNFGERDRWWGLVVEGFQEPMYCMNYNYPYYQQLFEQ